jgi:hypothetical protein
MGGSKQVEQIEFYPAVFVGPALQISALQRR